MDTGYPSWGPHLCVAPNLGSSPPEHAVAKPKMAIIAYLCKKIEAWRALTCQWRFQQQHCENKSRATPEWTRDVQIDHQSVRKGSFQPWIHKIEAFKNTEHDQNASDSTRRLSSRRAAEKPMKTCSFSVPAFQLDMRWLRDYMWLRTVYSEYTQYTSLRRIDSVSDADPSGYRHHATANDWVQVPVPMQKWGDWT
jgi:hypothetical protein